MNNLISQSVKVPHRSGHYLGHHFMYTANIGEIVPVLCQPLIPNSRVSLKTLLSASLAPLASDTYLRTSMRLEAFFTPMRFLYGGYENWLCRDVVYSSPTDIYANRLGVKLPYLNVKGSSFKVLCGPGSLADFLGVRVLGGTSNPNNDEIYDDDDIRLNYFPFACYHYIWDNWYRRADVQVPFFRRPKYGTSQNINAIAYLPYITVNGSSASDYGLQYFSVSTSTNRAFLETRQRNFPIDYFTSAMISPQLGDAQSVAVAIPASGDTSFTIAALRAANSLQVFRERLGLSGPRLVDFVRANYGADLSDGNARRPMYLGSASIEFYSKGVDQNAMDMQSGMVSSNNPFKSIGARYGQPISNGESTLIDDFTCDEPGYLMVMATAVPKVMYSSGIERYMLHYTRDGAETDLANPILQNVGNQEIKAAEIFGGDVIEPNGTTSGSIRPNDNINKVFAYQQRYIEYMQRVDRVSGKFRDSQSLASFVSQRNVGPNVSFGSNFLSIPANYLNQVSAVSTEVGDYGVMADMYFDFGVSQPLYDSSIPSLVNPSEEHGRDVVVMRGGKRII